MQIIGTVGKECVEHDFQVQAYNPGERCQHLLRFVLWESTKFSERESANLFQGKIYNCLSDIQKRELDVQTWSSEKLFGWRFK